MGIIGTIFGKRTGAISAIMKSEHFDKLLMSKSEIVALKALAKKGYFDIKELEEYIEKGVIAEHNGGSSELPEKEEGKETIIQRIASTYRHVNAKFVLVEDDVIRDGLVNAGVNVLCLPDLIFLSAERDDISKDEAIELLEACKLLCWYKEEVIDYIIKEVHSL